MSSIFTCSVYTTLNIKWRTITNDCTIKIKFSIGEIVIVKDRINPTFKKMK